jgi:taurine dioxygenase
MIVVEPIDAPCGATVRNIDLSAEITEELATELRQAWLQYHVLVFPDQILSLADLERFTLHFGNFGDDPFFNPIEGSSHIAAISRDANETTPLFAENWHTDWSFQAKPPIATCLYGIKIPPLGVYSDRHKKNTGRSMSIDVSDEARRTHNHPFIRAHTETGGLALYSTAGYIQGFVGMGEEESKELLQELYQYQGSPQFVYRHKWQPNMLVMWDNRSVLHKATGGYDGHDRLLHRTTISQFD